MQEYFEIGQIVNTSGLKGLVKVNLFTDDITKIEEFDKVIIEKNKKQQEYEIEEVKYHKNQALIKFKGIDNIDEAEKLRNSYIKIHRDDEPELPEDTYYIVDLIGLEVFSDDERKLGILKDVYPIPSGEHDIYVVDTGDKELLLPAIGEVIMNIDIANKKIYPASRLAPGIPPAVDALIEDALKEDPKERLQSVDEFWSRLSAINPLPEDPEKTHY